jgi:hypothetical protein
MLSCLFRSQGSFSRKPEFCIRKFLAKNPVLVEKQSYLSEFGEKNVVSRQIWWKNRVFLAYSELMLENI